MRSWELSSIDDTPSSLRVWLAKPRMAVPLLLINFRTKFCIARRRSRRIVGGQRWPVEAFLLSRILSSFSASPVPLPTTRPPSPPPTYCTAIIRGSFGEFESACAYDPPPLPSSPSLSMHLHHPVFLGGSRRWYGMGVSGYPVCTILRAFGNLPEQGTERRAMSATGY